MRQKETAVIPIPRRMEITAVLCFQSRHDKLPFAVCICTCEENEGLQREHLFAAGFPIGARSIPVGTRFCSAKSSVLYLCFRLTRERGWRRTLRCGRVWQQTLFRGSRTGGFCDGGLRHKRRIFEKQNPTGRKRKQRYIKPPSRRSDVPSSYGISFRSVSSDCSSSSFVRFSLR